MNSKWNLLYKGFNPSEESLRESLCTLGNGYFGTRGTFPGSKADNVHYPGTYVNGVYNQLKDKIDGHEIENESLVNAPNWLVLKFKQGSEWFDLKKVHIISYQQKLDIRHGILTRSIHFRDNHGRETSMTERRIVHMKNMHLAALEIKITPKNWSGIVQIHSALDGTVSNSQIKRYRQLSTKHLRPVKTGTFNKDGIYLLTETNQSHIRIAESARTRIYSGNKEKKVKRNLVRKRGYIAQNISFRVNKKNPVKIEKIVSLYTSNDHAIYEPCYESVKALNNVERFDKLLGSHILAWKHLWEKFDVEIGNSVRNQMILRLHIFHLLQTVSINSIGLDISVPARGLHGEAYRGHIFWDELFILPFITLRMPEVTRSLLLYRYRRLEEARLNAKQQGLKGALYPWQSGSDGKETSQKIHLNPLSGRWLPDHSHLQRHVNVAIAYNVWEYYEITDDIGFLSEYGAEIILEVARCLASLTTYNKKLGRFEIRGVIGPDEYHDKYPWSDKPGLDNNAYTNIMTVWTLDTAIKTLGILPSERKRELQESMSLDNREVERWKQIIRKMRVVFHDKDIISQFEKYEKLKEFDWKAYRIKYGNIHRLDRILESENDTPNNYKASKQADVLMLFYLFSTKKLKELFKKMGYRFDARIMRKNVDYYLDRTSHGSTLSNVVHSWVLSRLDRPASWRYFIKSLESDVLDIQGGTTKEGIHLGAMAGTEDIAQRCYTGMEFRNKIIFFDPSLPKELRKVKLKIMYRGNWLDILVTHSLMKISSGSGQDKKIKMSFYNKVCKLKPGKELSLSCK